VARFARIYPLYAVALLFAVPQLVHDVRLASASPVGAGRLAGVVIASIAMVQAWFAQYVCLWNCPTWSLSAEAFYYALFPLALLLATSRPRRTLLLVLSAAGMGLILMGAADAAGPSFAVRAAEASLNPLVRLPEFLLGCWLGGFFLARRPSWSASPVIVVVAVVGIIALAIWAGEHRTFTAPHLVAAPLFALLILAVAAMPDPGRGILAIAPLVLLGEASYALYLLHGPLHGYTLAAFNRLAPGTTAGTKFVVYAIAAIGLSIVSFQGLERPMRVWLRERLARRT
jgi:peptidoglycan/LPS O-acetylase OafA/YrhL